MNLSATHASQSNETAAKLNLLLNAPDPVGRVDLADGGEIDTEDLLAAQMSAKVGGAQTNSITWIAFTAKPKDKTRRSSAFRPIRPDARHPAAVNLPAAFHVHSMRHATEEGFMLDVLANYTSYSMRSRSPTRPARRSWRRRR